MPTRIKRVVLAAIALILTIIGLIVTCRAVPAATVQSRNFTVESHDQQSANAVSTAAETARQTQALAWLGRELPPWSSPCPVAVHLTRTGAGGATTFQFDRGRVVGIRMNVEGDLARIVGSVIPHEVTHCIWAVRFGRPLPRWADEGAATMSEERSEQLKQDAAVRQALNAGRAFKVRSLLAMYEYPSDVGCLYCQGHSLANYLVGVGGRARLLAFVEGGLSGDWDRACRDVYSAQSVEALEQSWLTAMRSSRGNPALAGGESGALAGAPSAPVSAASSASDPVLSALGRIEQRLAAVDRLAADVSDLKARMDRLEGRVGGWSQTPQRNIGPALAVPNCPPGRQ